MTPAQLCLYPGDEGLGEMPGDIDHFETSQSFAGAMARQFGPIDLDLAATMENTKFEIFIRPEDDALDLSWSGFANSRCCHPAGWLNPEYGKREKGKTLGDWVRKAWHESLDDFRVVMLTPSNMGSSWMWLLIAQGWVFLLDGRMGFGGPHGTGKFDCAVSILGPPPLMLEGVPKGLIGVISHKPPHDARIFDWVKR